MRATGFAAASVLLFLAHPVLATQPVALGPQFTVAPGAHYTFSSSSNDGYALDAKVASAPGGDFVVVWDRYVETEFAYGHQVTARRFDASGKPLGGEVQVGALADRYHIGPGIVMDGAGNSLIVWGDNSTEWAARYDASGAPIGVPFAVNQGVANTNEQNHNVAAFDAGGNFVVAWERVNLPSGGISIVARRFDAAGAPRGDEFQVNSSPGPQGVPRYAGIASDDAGDFIVVWYDGHQVPGQLYDSTGAPVGGQFIALEKDTDETGPTVAADPAGTFVVTDGNGGFLRRWDPTGTPIGDLTRSPEVWTTLATDRGGNFVVIGVGDSNKVAGQRYDALGQPAGQPFDVSAEDADFPSVFGPAVATDAHGDFVVVWSTAYVGYQPHASYGVVFGRRFGICGDGHVTPGHACDDGNDDAYDGCNPVCAVETCFTCAGEPSSCARLAGCNAVCSGGATIDDKATVVVSRIGAPAGDEKIALKGTIHGAPFAAGQYKPFVEGAEISITTDALVFELAAPLAVPPGFPGTGCGPLDGWRVSKTNYTYKNLSNALPPACTPGSARGLRVMKIKDKIAKDGTIAFQVTTKQSTLPPLGSGSLTATIVLGQSPAAGTSGRCARLVFTRKQASGTTARFFP